MKNHTECLTKLKARLVISKDIIISRVSTINSTRDFKTSFGENSV